MFKNDKLCFIKPIAKILAQITIDKYKIIIYRYSNRHASWKCFILYYNNNNNNYYNNNNNNKIKSQLAQSAFKGSMIHVFAIRINYRNLLRSSSLWEPRHPSFRVHFFFFLIVL
jgi:hypothetical protein